MVQVPIISGIAARGVDFRTAYPINLIPVPKVQGISEGYLRPADGIMLQTTGPGRDRGGFRYKDEHYRVMGTTLVRVPETGGVVSIGTIDGADWCTFDEGFTHVAINGGNNTYLYDGTTLAQITDVDLGVSLDVLWINGYFVSTDGEFLVVTDLTDPFAVNPLKYASSEVAPDPVVALQKIRSEIYAVNRYTIEIFAALDSPGAGFPFARREGAQIMKGAIGSRACCEYMEAVAFLGGGSNEATAIWLGGQGTAQKISTREIDQVLHGFGEEVLAGAVLEARTDEGHDFLYVHLPTMTLVFDGGAAKAIEQPVWFILRSGAISSGYRARGHVWCYGRWNVGDPFGSSVGYLTADDGAHFGEAAQWEFSTPIIYNAGAGAIVHELELVALNGVVSETDDPVLQTQWSEDGVSWSQPRQIYAGRRGQRVKRLSWDRQGKIAHWRIQRFTGNTNARLSFARLEAKMEPLQW